MIFVPNHIAENYTIVVKGAVAPDIESHTIANSKHPTGIGRIQIGVAQPCHAFSVAKTDKDANYILIEEQGGRLAGRMLGPIFRPIGAIDKPLLDPFHPELDS
jgi:hypothetical protein